MPPIGATAAVDPATWLIADRLSAPTYTADTTAAMVDGLAGAGVATFADTTSATPEVPLSAVASPFELLDFQVHALAVGAWAGATWSGAELDGLIPLPAQSDGIAPASVLVAAYVATADTPGGALSRALMAGQDLLQPGTLQFPGVVLVLFASDLATAGGQVAVPRPSPSPGAGLDRSRLLALAAGAPHADLAADAPIAVGSLCSSVANWIHSTIDWLFDALKVAASSNPFLAFFGSIWNFVVDRLHAFVEGVITSVTDTILGTVRSIAASIAAVAEQIASILPFAVKMEVSGVTQPNAISLATSPLPGAFTATVSAGDLPAWPPLLQDCANVAKVTLPDFTTKNVPLTWAPVQPAANPLLASSGTPSSATDDTGQAVWAFQTSPDPGDPTGPDRQQLDNLHVAVHRPELDRVRNAVTNALLGFVPTILRPVVGALLAPALDAIQANLNKLIDARGTGYVWLLYHDKLPPTPAPSGPCSPSPVAPGSYKGTTTNVSREVIDQGSFGGVVATDNGSGSAALTIAADGTADGTWDMTSNDVFDETAAVDGVVGLKAHRVSTSKATGSLSGTACDLQMTFLTNHMTSCTDTLKGDCSGEQPPASGTLPGGLGGPTSVSAGGATWTYNISSNDGAVITDTLTITVSSAAP